MTLDVLFHLLKTLSPEKSTADEKISALITLLSSESHRSEALSPFIHRLHLLSFAQKAPGNAEELLLAHITKDDGLFPQPDFADWPRVRYAESGEVQTPESEEYFRKMTSAANVLRSSLIDEERAKGTPALYILDKLLNLNSALPERYKKMANIPYA
ncbi:TPA: hypothetical protein ACIAIH_000496 [Enterobacter bugandensis]